MPGDPHLLTIEALSAQAFRPFGDVIEASASARHFAINGGYAERYHDLARIDVSGDGPNNNGRIVTHARDEALEKGITINGLPLVGIREWFSPADIKELDIYYEDCVIGGPEAFSITVRDTRSFVDATRNKLVREIAALPPPRIGTQHASGKIPRGRVVQTKEPRISCTIGESLWRGRWGN